MIRVDKTDEPQCLTLLKSKSDSTYSDLRGDCRKEVTQKLSTDQKHLCAYCQRTFESTVFIEHYDPQSSKAKELDFDNFLGVCSGVYYIEKKSGKKIKFCSSERGNNVLTINPLNQSDIDTIYYDDEDRICSTNDIFQKELSQTLNLNFFDLCFDREAAFEEEKKSYLEMASEMDLSPIETYTRAIRIIKNGNPKFSGFLLFRFHQSLEYHKKKQK
jgi:uncharacterized protein (TIGR02646 family)